MSKIFKVATVYRAATGESASGPSGRSFPVEGFIVGASIALLSNSVGSTCVAGISLVPCFAIGLPSACDKFICSAVAAGIGQVFSYVPLKIRVPAYQIWYDVILSGAVQEAVFSLFFESLD
jgi:hypothetical protein